MRVLAAALGLVAVAAAAVAAEAAAGPSAVERDGNPGLPDDPPPVDLSQPGRHRMSDVFRLELRGRTLVARTQPGPNDFRTQRVQIEGFDAPALVTFTQLDPDVPGQVQFEITMEEYPGPDSSTRLRVLSRPHMVQIDKTSRSDKGIRKVTLTQHYGLVRLAIFDATGGDGDLGSTTLSEPDLFALRRLHPRETEHWLRPLFRQLRQESVLAPDPMIIWQVLADAWPLDPGIVEQVRAELPTLDATDFRERDEAVARLSVFGREAIFAARRIDRSGLSVEQNLRLDAVFARFAPLPALRAERLRDSLPFLLDCLYSEDPLARRLAAERLDQVAGTNLGFDAQAARDRRDAAVDALRQRLLGVPAMP